MRFNSFLIELVATPAYLLAAFIALLAISHLVFIKLLKMSAIAWKVVDYIWLGMAALGLITSSSRVDQYISIELLNNLEIPRMESIYRSLRYWVDSAASSESGVCLTRVRSELSPDEFYDMVDEQQTQCSYFRALDASLPASVSSPFEHLSDIGYIPYAGSTKYENFYLETLQQYAEEYEEQRRLVRERELSAQTSDIEALMMIFGPILLCFALALRMTKVTAEIKNEKDKAV